jgi:hypothetical protein
VERTPDQAFLSVLQASHARRDVPQKSIIKAGNPVSRSPARLQTPGCNTLECRTHGIDQKLRLNCKFISPERLLGLSTPLSPPHRLLHTMDATGKTGYFLDI